MPSPALVVFGLQYTLFPFWIDPDVEPPFRKLESGLVVDKHDMVLAPYEDVIPILKKLKEDGVQIALTSCSTYPEAVQQLIDFFSLDNYISYKEVYPHYKWDMIDQIHNKSGIPYSDMIFFDDGRGNARWVTKYNGVYSILVHNGMDWKVFNEGIEAYREWKASNYTKNIRTYP